MADARAVDLLQSLLLQYLQAGVVVHGPDSRILLANEAAARFLGLSMDQLLGKSKIDPDWSFVREDGSTMPVEEYPVHRVLTSQRPFRGMVVGVNRPGRGDRVWGLTNAFPEFEPDGSLKRVVVTFVDATERRRAEERQLHLTNVLRAIRNVNQLITQEKDRSALLRRTCALLTESRGYRSAWIALRDEQGGLGAVGESGLGEGFKALREKLASGVWPLCCRDAAAQSGCVVLHDTLANCVGCPIAGTYRDTAALAINLRYEGHDFGVLVVALPAALADDEEEQGLFREVAGDLAFALHALEADESRQQAEAERARLQAQLVQAQKLESIGQLAGGVAHDFNNMLGVILGHAELGLKGLEPAAPLAVHLHEIRKAAEHSAALTRQLLAFARKQTVAPRVLDLNATVESLLKMLTRLIGEHLDLAWMPGADAGPVKMDPSQLDQILTNLCVNARDAISGTGKITIETAAAAFDEDYCAVHAGYVPGDYVMLAVSDDGCGMSHDTIARLFEPFFTTKELGKGTGLGLATVYGIVRQNHGFINVYSEPGQGSTFRIYLPRHAARVEASPVAPAADAPAGGHETILLVEDEVALLKLTFRMLELQGYHVLAASTAGEALRLAGSHEGRIDLLLTDVVMPEMNGRELAKRLLLRHPGLKRLFMSGYTSNVIAHHGILDEGVHFIQKPFGMGTLAEALRKALGSP